MGAFSFYLRIHHLHTGPPIGDLPCLQKIRRIHNEIAHTDPADGRAKTMGKVIAEHFQEIANGQVAGHTA